MSDNVGLSTPRGSGTSGYVQRNLAHMRPRDRAAPYPQPRDLDSLRHRQRLPDKGILEHDRKREIEVRVFELRDKLEDEGLEEEEIDRRCDLLRKELKDKAASQNNNPRSSSNNNNNSTRNLKSHQVHELAEAKIRESERLRNALKISKNYEEGGHWKRQEEQQRLRRERDSADGGGGGGGGGR
ncbi:pre-mRNA splicing factor CWC21 [Xylariaceae sp. FL0594]|nr:pre-mRNA splicing factor CWC21 [Xylariaceae sp. FL0594]